MQPVTADLAGLEGRAIPYRWATPGQHARAGTHGRPATTPPLPLAVAVWSQVFHEYQPALWEDRTGICLDHADLVQLAQRVAHSLLAPDLDPPIYCEAARYLAEGYAYFGQVAAMLRPELEAGPLARNRQLMALLEQLEIGNAVAERVLQATWT